MRALQADAFGLTSADTVLIAVPMFHANGWGLPFAAPAVGAKLVLRSLRSAVPDWWLPEKVIRVERMPLAATGKIDKVRLRADHADSVGDPN